MRRNYDHAGATFTWHRMRLRRAVAHGFWYLWSTSSAQGFSLGSNFYPALFFPVASPRVTAVALKLGDTSRARHSFNNRRGFIQHSLVWRRSYSTRRASAAVAMASLTTSASRRLGKLLPPSTVFFVCDIQERFRDAIHNMPAVISTGRFMVDLSKALDVPCIATEQYPKALLHTVPELNIGEGPEQHKLPVFAKKLFSMCTEEVLEHLQQLQGKPTDVVLFGIEAHVCVTQTCLDLLERGYGVHIVCDGVSSQKPYDRTVALHRMQQAGAFLSTAEQVAFQLTVSAEHPNFKKVSGLVKARNAEGNAFLAMSSL